MAGHAGGGLSMVRVLHLLRWPLALLLAVLAGYALPPLGQAARALATRPALWQPLVLGLALYAGGVALAWRLGRGASGLALLMTLEHELAHTLVAWCLGLRVHQLVASDEAGGHVLTNGQSWLVLLAPYVLPMALLVPALVLAAASPAPFWALVLLGAGLGFHVHSSWVETHRDQTDLQIAGWPLSAVFIASTHVLMALWALGLALGHQRHLMRAGQGAWAALRHAVAG